MNGTGAQFHLPCDAHSSVGVVNKTMRLRHSFTRRGAGHVKMAFLWFNILTLTTRRHERQLQSCRKSHFTSIFERNYGHHIYKHGNITATPHKDKF